MNDDATMNEYAGKFEGRDRYECRAAWVKELEEAGFLVKTENLTIPVGKCYRCHNAIEPMMSEQWFVKMAELAKPAIEAAESGRMKHVPDRFEKVYSQGMSNVTEIWVDKETGIQYLYHSAGYGAGITPLLDKEGKPSIYDPYK
jgi:valyl-tRNA synthetase